MNGTRKILLSILIILAGIILIKCFLPTPFRSNIAEDQVFISKLYQKNACDIVIGGDSRTYQGIAPFALSSVLGKENRVYNFGFSSTGLSEEYLDFLMSNFSSDTKRKILILGINAHSFTDLAFSNEHWNEHEQLSLSDKLSLHYFGGFLTFFQPYSINEHFKDQDQILNRNFYPENGFIGSNQKNYDLERTFSIYKNIFATNKCQQKNISLFMNKVAEIQAKGIAVFLVKLPIHPALDKIEEVDGEFNYKAFKNEAQKKEIYIFDFNAADFKTFDGSHLSEQEAERFSKILAREIQQKLN